MEKETLNWEIHRLSIILLCESIQNTKWWEEFTLSFGSSSQAFQTSFANLSFDGEKLTQIAHLDFNFDGIMNDDYCLLRMLNFVQNCSIQDLQILSTFLSWLLRYFISSAAFQNSWIPLPFPPYIRNTFALLHHVWLQGPSFPRTELCDFWTNPWAPSSHHPFISDLLFFVPPTNDGVVS